MRNRINKLIKIILFLSIAVFPLAIFAADDPLAEYQHIIDEANKTPPPSNVLNDGQAALTPSTPFTKPIAPNTPDAAGLSPLSPVSPVAPIQQPAEPKTPPASPQTTNTDSTTNAGPPNIFAPPSGNSSPSQGNSVIHY